LESIGRENDKLPQRLALSFSAADHQSDVDGYVEDRSQTISVFNGPASMVLQMDSPEQEFKAVADWLSDMTKTGIAPHEIGVFVRSTDELNRATNAVTLAVLPYLVLDER
jgi:hypothetical protein